MLTELFLRILNKYNRMEMKPLRLGDCDPLNPKEIHTVEAIGKQNGINVTELARVMGITKGGVSQMVTRLSKKGLVAKTKDGLNDKEVKLRLTPEGLKAFRGHENMHAALYADLLRALEGVSAAEIERVRTVLAKIDYHLDRYSEDQT